jgi:hypothetical protein
MGKIEPGLTTHPAARANEAVAPALAKDSEALARSYGPSELKGLLQSGFVVRCAIFAAMGGFLFGMTLVVPELEVLRLTSTL